MVNDFKSYRQQPGFYPRRILSHLRAIASRLGSATRGVRKRDSNLGASQWAVCFFGVDRSLPYTFGSIKRKIFDPLHKKGIGFRVISHFNQLNPSGGNRDSIHLLNSDVGWVEPQDDQNIQVELRATQDADWKIDSPYFKYAKKNLLHQLHSLSRIKQLIDFTTRERFQVYAILRADLFYLDELDVESIQDQIMGDHCDVVTPSWQQWGGLNDRFCFVSGLGLETVLMRRTRIGEFAKEKGYVHAEELLKYVVDRDKLRCGYTDLRAERVRKNGRVQFEPFE